MVQLTDFEKKVLEKLKGVPRGKITTYKYLAEAVGKPRAVRAVGNAVHKNPWAPRVPCHRVVRGDGSLGGFASGPKKKEALLKKEKIVVQKNKIVDFNSKLFDFR